mmetsp:Transcript_46303/g.83498  ORF Transcript_46303/g.83498 Transcript_46303/m.83498 type:complete len:569 (+) Transcript_46303:86-1792(+)
MARVSVPQLRTDVAQHAAEIEAQQEDGFSPDFLRHYCGTQDLDQVLHLEIQVDSALQSLELFGQTLPNLRQMKLTDSSILSLRDLGTCLGQLEVLWMSRCGLQDLGGASATLPALREFYLPFNDVVDLAPLCGCENLEVLDIEGNAVTDEDEVSALSGCHFLRELTLSGNPVFRASCRNGALSRERVLQLLPTLEVLDDAPTNPDAPSSRCKLPLDEPLTDDLLNEDYNFLSGLGERNGLSSSHRRPSRRAVVQAGDIIDIDDMDGGGGATSSTEPIEPLEPQHPLLAEGLKASNPFSKEPGFADDPFAQEPDETELIVERLKRARGRNTPHALTARPAVGAAWSGFGFQVPERRQVRTAGNAEVEGFRPATSSGLRLEDLGSGSKDSASELTVGEQLAGTPNAGLRQRRLHASGASTARGSDMDIRELLQFYQTFTQPSAISAEEISARKADLNGKRLSTPDVRVRPMSGTGGLAPTNLQEIARRPSSSGLDSQSSAGPLAPRSRPDSGHSSLQPLPSRPPSGKQTKRRPLPPALKGSNGTSVSNGKVDRLVLDHGDMALNDPIDLE